MILRRILIAIVLKLLRFLKKQSVALPPYPKYTLPPYPAHEETNGGK